MKLQFLISVRFLFEKLISIVIEKKLPLFDLQIQYVRHLLIFTVTIITPLNILTIM